MNEEQEANVDAANELEAIRNEIFVLLAKAHIAVDYADERCGAATKAKAYWLAQIRTALGSNTTTNIVRPTGVSMTDTIEELRNS